MNITPEYIEYRKRQTPASPIFLKMFEKMAAAGKLKGSPDDEALEAVISEAEKIVAEYMETQK